MFGSRSSREILRPYLERLAGSYYISGPEKEAFIEQTVSYLANDPDLLVESPIEKVLAEAMARVYHANHLHDHRSGSGEGRRDEGR
jgi:hypothetical protein